MIRRLFVWSCLLLSLLLLWTCSVEAQCHGYSANVQYTPLSPANAAQLGALTATLTVQATSDAGGTNPLPGSAPSHNLTVTPGTGIAITFSSNNLSRAYMYYTYKGSTVNEGWYPLNGTGHWYMGGGDIGNPYVLYFVGVDANGNFATQDRVIINTVAGIGPSLVNQDAIFTNVYIQVSIPFGGPSMATACDICVQAEYKCNGAVHTPYVTMSAVNHTSGESQSLPRQLAGNPASQYQSISGNGSIMISALPNDTIDGTANAEILCSMLGDLPITGNDDWHIQFEWAWTKVSTIQNTCVEVPQMGGGVRCNVTPQYMTSQACSPPDFSPATIYSNFPVGTPPAPVTPATMPPFWWTWSIGIRPRVTGFPWFFPASDLGAILQKDYFALRILSGAFPSNSTVRDATNYDKGCGVPSPFPPFDQP